MRKNNMKSDRCHSSHCNSIIFNLQKREVEYDVDRKMNCVIYTGRRCRIILLTIEKL